LRSKALVRFLNRAARFDADIELVDVVCIAINRGDLTPADGGRILVHVDPTMHPRLANQKASDHNRQLVVGHLRKTMYSSYIKDLYEDFTDYPTDLVMSATRKGLSPDKLRGEYKLQVAVDDLLECGSWENVLATIEDTLYRRFDGMGNAKKIAFLDKKLGLDLDRAVIDSAMPFLDLRHLLVHTDGVADDAFCDRFPGFGAWPNEPVKLSEETTRDARVAVTSLVEHIDAQAILTGILADEDQQ